MPHRDWRLSVDDILEAAERIEGFTLGVTYEEFLASTKTQHAIAFNIMIIGEAAARMPQEIQARNAAIPWADMRAMRNIIVHGYWELSLPIVWKTATEDIPLLLPALRDLLAEQ